MYTKSLLALAVIAGVTGQAFAVQTQFPQTHAPEKQFGWERKVPYVVNADINTTPTSEGRYRYIVQLADKPAALEAAALVRKSGKAKYTVLKTGGGKAENPVRTALKSSEMRSYKQTLAAHKAVFRNDLQKALGRSVQSKLEFSNVFNGMVLELSEAEAQKLLSLPQVVRVTKSIPQKLATDNGPTHIGADKVWAGGGALGTVPAMGEGVIVGDLDTGINTDNRAFAATGDDGYTVVNPLGDGNYLGDCATDATLCNSKLIGIYSYPQITDAYQGVRPANGEDYNGHGSHTASTAAGNVLLNVPILLPGFGETHDGIDTGSVFPKISGVAPHANLIMYQVCNSQGCYPELTVASVEHAIEDGVDVLNYSIGPGGGYQPDPWDDSSAIAFLAAREAGIVVVMAAGNDGPGASTDGNEAPWALSVAAATHERNFVHTLSGTNTAGPALPDITGAGGVTTAMGDPATISPAVPVVYAGDYNYVDGEGVTRSLRYCDYRLRPNNPLWASLADKIVVCDRGGIALVDKAINMIRAKGIVIRSVPESNQDLPAVTYQMPGVVISQADGVALVDWIHNSTEPMMTMSAASTVYDPALADILAAFSSRGPYAKTPELMIPHLAAPGVEIYAAYADEMPFFEGAPADFTFLNGTSMATPHVTGAAALMKQLHPDWTAAEIQSALMLTANPVVKKEDGVTAADLFDAGSGAIRVDRAAIAGLVMDVPVNDFKAANPAMGGDPSTLNMPFMVSDKCAPDCTFTRTFRATKAGSYHIAQEGAVDGVLVNVSPSDFTLTSGQAVTVTFTARIASRVEENWNMLRFSLTPEDITAPTLTLPFAVKPLPAIIPSLLRQDYFWSTGDIAMPGLRFRYPTDVVLAPKPLEKAETIDLLVSPDSDNRTAFEDVRDGTSIQMVDVPENATHLRVAVGESEAKDVDLYVGLDSNNDGIPQVVELTMMCATDTNVGEGCEFVAGAGRYWVMVHNFEGSGAPADKVRLDVMVGPTSPLTPTTAYAPGMSTVAYTPTNILLNWVGDLAKGVYYGSLEVFDRTSDTSARPLGTTQMVINRTSPVVTVDATPALVHSGEEVVFNAAVPKNPTSIPLSYTLTLNLDSHLEYTGVSAESGVSASGSVDGNNTVTVTVALDAGRVPTEAVKIHARLKPSSSGTFTSAWSLDSSKAGFEVQSGSVSVSNDNHAPVAGIAATASGEEGETLTLDGALSKDADGDSLTYTWKQLNGLDLKLTDLGNGKASVTIPALDHDRMAEVLFSVSDGEFTTSQVVSVQMKKVTDTTTTPGDESTSGGSTPGSGTGSADSGSGGGGGAFDPKSLLLMLLSLGAIRFGFRAK